MKIEFVALGLLLLVSCGESDDSGKKEYYSAVEAGGQNQKEYLDENAEELTQAEREMAEAAENTTTLKFEKMEHSFGKIKLESENDCEFKVTNTGKKPLLISNVDASCGCTTPQKPEKPIQPGKSDVIKVHFKPSSKSIEGKPVEKTVTVTANTDPRITVLRINAIVE